MGRGERNSPDSPGGRAGKAETRLVHDDDDDEVRLLDDNNMAAPVSAAAAASAVAMAAAPTSPNNLLAAKRGRIVPKSVPNANRKQTPRAAVPLSIGDHQGFRPPNLRMPQPMFGGPATKPNGLHEPASPHMSASGRAAEQRRAESGQGVSPLIVEHRRANGSQNKVQSKVHQMIDFMAGGPDRIMVTGGSKQTLTWRQLTVTRDDSVKLTYNSPNKNPTELSIPWRALEDIGVFDNRIGFTLKFSGDDWPKLPHPLDLNLKRGADLAELRRVKLHSICEDAKKENIEDNIKKLKHWITSASKDASTNPVPRREQPPKWADWLEEPKEALLPEIMSSSTPSAVDPIDTAQKPVRTRHVNKEEEALSKTAAPSAALPAWTRQADDVPVTRQRTKAFDSSSASRQTKPPPTRPRANLSNPKPYANWHGYTLTVGDYARLSDGEFLNDTIINGYLEVLYAQLSPAMQKRIHFFNTFFYEALTKRASKNNTTGYESVKKWTKAFDIFEKDYLVVPINEDAHWYLAIICHPSKAFLHDEEPTPQKPRPAPKRKKDTHLLIEYTNRRAAANPGAQITIHDSDDEDEAGSKAKAVKVLALEEDQSNGRGRSPSLQVKERAAGREADASADLDNLPTVLTPAVPMEVDDGERRQPSSMRDVDDGERRTRHEEKAANPATSTTLTEDQTPDSFWMEDSQNHDGGHTEAATEGRPAAEGFSQNLTADNEAPMNSDAGLGASKDKAELPSHNKAHEADEAVWSTTTADGVALGQAASVKVHTPVPQLSAANGDQSPAISDVLCAADAGAAAAAAAAHCYPTVPCILLFDSLGHKRKKAFVNLQTYLKDAWAAKHPPRKAALDFVTVEAPRQTNTCDCGVYLLAYVEHFFSVGARKPESTPKSQEEVGFEIVQGDKTHDVQTWFQTSFVSNLRRRLKSLSDQSRIGEDLPSS